MVTGFFIGLRQLSLHACLAKLHKAANLADVQPLFANHRHDSKLELRAECLSFLLLMFLVQVGSNPSRYPLMLDQHSPFSSNMIRFWPLQPNSFANIHRRATNLLRLI